MRALLKTIDCTAVPVYVNPNSTLPRFRDSRARAAAPVIIAVSAAATVLLLGFLLARTPIRRSGLAHFLPGLACLRLILPGGITEPKRAADI
jgi:hypothetical protein